MKKIMKWLYATVIQFLESLVSIASVLLFSKCGVSKQFKTIRKSMGTDDVCFILANGPSLKIFLEKGEYPEKGMFVVNMFAFSPFFQKLKPDNYIVADQSMCGRANPEDQEDVEKVYAIINTIDWEMNMFFPSDISRAFVERVITSPYVHVVYYNRTPVKGYKGFRHFLYRNNMGMPLPQNISNAAVFVAINVGYQKIYLYGVEHSWLKNFECNPETHKLYMNDGHFYREEEMRYFKKGDYCNWLQYIHDAMQSHFELRDYADSLGVKVINKTDYTFVEAYEFDEY